MLDFLKRIFGGNDPGNVCGFCGKKLFGAEVYRVEDKYCCSECYRRKHPENFCADCGNAGPLYVWNGKKYCANCFEARKRKESCRVCGCVLTGREGKNELIMAPGEKIVCCDDCCREIRSRDITTMDALRYLISIRNSQRPKPLQELTGHGIMRAEEIREERLKKDDSAVLKAGGQKYDAPAGQESGRREAQQPGNVRDLLPGLEKLVIDETPHGKQLRECIMAYKEAWHRNDEDKNPENGAAVSQTLRHLVEVLHKTPVLLPVVLKADSQGARYGTLHYSRDGAAILSSVEAVRLIREDRIGEMRGVFLYMPKEPDKLKRVTFVKQQEQKVGPDSTLWNIRRFDGCDGWSFGSLLNELGPWYAMMVEAAGNSYIALYTDLQAMKLLHKEENWPCTVVVSAAEVLQILRLTPACAGLIINPNAETHCMLRRQLFFPEQTR